jgi:polyisoprenoid-binding protein YceI
MMISNVRGSFGKVEGTIEYDREHPEQSRIKAQIDVKSINTNDEKRDAHLKSADFLDADKFPKIEFTSKKIVSAGSDEWKITGDLTIHGVTKEVVLNVEGPTPEVTDPFGSVRVGASATTKIKRSDFGMTWNQMLETGGVFVGDDLKIELDVSAIRAQAAAA